MEKIKALAAGLDQRRANNVRGQAKARLRGAPAARMPRRWAVR
jgi:hypothetical protein